MTEHHMDKLGSRISSRLVKIGLHDEIGELRGQIVRPAEFDSQRLEILTRSSRCGARP